MIRATKRGGTTPAVAYYRMSSKKQDTSIPAQKVEVEKYAAANGYRILRWKEYTDEGISGAESEKREGFKRLMRDAVERGDFQVILCWDQDRFSRFDPMEANFYWYQLREAGVRIVTVRQGELDLNELGGWLMASINQHGKAQYLRDLSANVLRGRLRKAENGLWVGSRAPYGYAVDPGSRLVLGDDQAVETVRYIFREYVSRDTSLRDIGQALTERGVPSPSGGDVWYGSKVQVILRRDAYASGRCAQLRESKGKFNTVNGRAVVPAGARAGSTVKPAKEWFYVDCPVIIDDETWQLASAKLKRRRGRTTPTKGGGSGLFNGLLYCGHCGKRMAASGKPPDSSGDTVYCCQTYNVRGSKGCQRNLVHQAALLPFLVSKLQELMLAPHNAKRLDAEMRKQLAAKATSKPNDKRRLTTAIEKLDRELKAAVAELKRTPDDLYEMACADVRDLRGKRDGLVAELEAMNEAPAAATQDADARVREAMARVNRLMEMLQSADPATVREALARVCERIDLWFDHKKHKKITRSFFSRGIITFRPPTDLSRPASRPGSNRRQNGPRVDWRGRSRSAGLADPLG